MQRIIEKTLERNMPPDELHLNLYYSRCRVFVISGYKEEVRTETIIEPLTKSQLKAKLRKEKKKGVTSKEPEVINDAKVEPEDPGHVVYELFDSSNVDFIPASIACVGKDDLCLCLFTTDKHYLRQGYGTQLMSTLKTVYAGQKLHLYVRVENDKAIAFYKANGWVDVGVVPDFYWDTLNSGDAMKMELSC